MSTAMPSPTPNASAGDVVGATGASRDASLVTATIVGVAAVVGLVGSAASLVLGDFDNPDDRWVAVGGVALGAIALIATWSLLRRIQRVSRVQLTLPLEARLFIASLRDAVREQRPLPERWEQRAVEFYGELLAAGLREDAQELESWTLRAQEVAAVPGGKH